MAGQWRYEWSMTVTWPDGGYRPASGVLERNQPGTHAELRQVLFAALTGRALRREAREPEEHLMASDVQLYPHILEGDVWHQRPDSDTGVGPTYPTRCSKTVTTYTVDVPGEKPTVDWWESLCPTCYLKP